MRFKLKYCAFGLLAAVMLSLAAATGAEKIYGSNFAHEHIYGAWWMVGLWAALGATAFLYIFRRRLYRRIPTFLLHCAFGLILAGALITFLTGERGHLHLRQGETARAFQPEEEQQQQRLQRALPFDVKLVLFDVEYHAGTSEPADFISFLKVDEEMCRVSMNKIHRHRGFRFYQLDYDPDEMGSTLLVSHDPWGIGVTYAGYLLLGLAMLWLLWLRMGWRGTGLLLLSVAAVWCYISQINPMTPVLRTPMLAAHVSVIMVSYALIVFITATSIVALCSRRRSERIYRRNATLLYPALFLLAAGIFVGAVWANISWGRYWGWDAKETWALITLLVYAVPLHRESFAFFRTPKNFHAYCAAASLAVLMTFFGVTFLLGGIHSYV
ncbi:MAG: cytochrome c biogenesis protein CcsA [Prevotellaceae bacterium]|jgi:ABC-type transport system involved in cytochrome c biogenesis permease subunit|nr:cytochrome c biogenesis protein CcsA [Prevotellaceae bacterium]